MTRARFAAPEWLIVVGSSVFVLTLAVSAVFIPEIRWLHLAQSVIYAVAVVLSLR